LEGKDRGVAATPHPVEIIDRKRAPFNREGPISASSATRSQGLAPAIPLDFASLRHNGSAGRRHPFALSAVATRSCAAFAPAV